METRVPAWPNPCPIAKEFVFVQEVTLLWIFRVLIPMYSGSSPRAVGAIPLDAILQAVLATLLAVLNPANVTFSIALRRSKVSNAMIDASIWSKLIQITPIPQFNSGDARLNPIFLIWVLSNREMFSKENLFFPWIHEFVHVWLQNANHSFHDDW